MEPSKVRTRRSPTQIAGWRELRALSASLGGIVGAERRRRRMTQQQLADRVGISRAREAELERGLGEHAPLSTWVGLGIALDRPFAATFSRALEATDPRDAGHLGAQEYILRLARRNKRDGGVELPVGRGWQPLSIDVVQRDRPLRVLIITEIWNRMDDMGAALRNHDRKVAAAEELAVVAGGDGPPYRVAACWVMRATAANRALVRRYPEVLRARFSGSSRAWLDCLTNGAPPPDKPGIVWIDLASSRLYEVRLSA